MAVAMTHDVILLAEDNDDHVILILRAFRKGALLNPVYVVKNGEEVIEYLQGHGRFQNRHEYPLPALLLLDLRMPMKNGFEVLEWIRSQPTLKGLRVVVLTTSEDLRDVNRAYELGANSFLVKPIDLDHFANLTDAIKGHWLWLSKAPTVERPEEHPAGRRVGHLE
jgi:CheY-like chemotaxis protein